jgi:hypothetical protein
VAWDVGGAGNTVLRGGFGVYRYHDAQQPYDTLIDLAYGVRQYSAGSATTLRALEEINSSALVFGGSALDINDEGQPVTYSWSATANQRLPWSMNIEFGYVGNNSDSLMNFDVSNYNAVPLGAMLSNPNGDPNPYRPLSRYGDLNVFRHTMYQNYHGLQALLSRQKGRFNFTGAYTYSKTLGVRSGDPGGSRTGSEFILDPRQYNYGVLGSDRTHVASVAYNWMFNEIEGNPTMNAVFGNWQITGISSYISGAPIVGNFDLQGSLADGTAISSTAISGSPQVRAQPVLTCDPRSNVPDGFLFNPTCFAAPSPGANGNYIFPYIKTQAYFNHDLSLIKNIPMPKQGHRLQFRISAYNLFNHPIRFPDPGRNLTLRFTNGVQTNTDFARLPEDNKFGRRIVQLVFRYTF